MTFPIASPTLPFFVYGTLLRGEPNHFHFDKALALATPATLAGAQLWNLGPYPMAIWGDGTIYGELLEVVPEKYVGILKALDRLEGVNEREPEKPGGLFHRARCEVVALQGPGQAWVYLGREDLARRGKMILNGDWKNRKFAQGTP